MFLTNLTLQNSINGPLDMIGDVRQEIPAKIPNLLVSVLVLHRGRLNGGEKEKLM